MATWAIDHDVRRCDLLSRADLAFKIHFTKDVSRGYVNDPVATDKTFTDGWIRSGDILRMDKNQNFWVTDRLKEVRFISCHGSIQGH